MTEGSNARSRKPQFPARKTVYKGIEMRSRLEAGFAMWLDDRRWTWTYEPCAFGNEDGQYLPDFRIENVHDVVTGRTAPAYIDVKPDYDLDVPALLRRMEIIWDSEPKAHLLVQAPARGAFEGFTLVRCLWKMDMHRSDGSTYEHRSDGGWAVWAMASPSVRRPTLCTPMPASEGPWHGEWWKAGTDMAPGF